MGTVYRKTAKGIGEIETRAHRLSPRMRSTLILVDGRKSDDELRRLVTQQLDETLAALATGGFIEATAVSESPVAAPAVPAQRQTSSGPSTRPPPGPAAAPNDADLAALRRDAVRALTDQVGPMGESLAMKIERCRDTAELRQLLDLAAQIIGNVRGAQAAAAYRSRFIAD